MKLANKRFNLLSCLLFLAALFGAAGLFMPLPLHANGQGEEDKLMHAQRLISEKKYDEANTLLAEIIKTDPDKFEQAQKLAQQIIKAQNNFNTVYEDLIKAIDRGDVEKAVSNIKILNEIDPTPNETVTNALNEAKYSAELAVNLKTFNQIMTTARDQLNHSQYLPALETYLTGFELHKEDFANSGYGNIVLDTVNRALARIMAAIERFKQLAPVYTAQETSLEEQIQKSDFSLFSNAQALFIDEYLALKQLVTELDEPAVAIRNQYDRLKGLSHNSNDLTTNKETNSGFFYLFYLDKLISGRRESAQEEGIQATIKLQAEESLRYLEDRVRNKAQATRLARNQAYQKEDQAATLVNNQNARILYTSLMQLNYLLAFGQVHKSIFEVKTEKDLIIKDGYPQLADYQEKLKETVTFEVLGDLLNKRLTKGLATTTKQPLTSLPTLNVATSLAQENGRQTAKLAGLILEWNAWRDKLTSLKSPAAADIQEMFTMLITEVNAFLNDFYQENQLYLQLLTQQIANEGLLLVHGETIKMPNADTGELERQVKYPQKRVDNLRSQKQYILTMNDNIQKIALPWTLATPDRPPEHGAPAPALPRELLQTLANADLTRTLDLLNSLIEKGNNLLRDADNQLNLATQEMLEAERYKKEGQKYYNASQAAFKQRDYAKARSTLESASTVFDKALEKQEDPEIRNLRDKVFPEFVVKINQAENERVVGEVRSLLEQGIQTYRENRYEAAELLLVKAQTRWQDTNKNINEEIEAWLSVVQRARNLRKGWEITEIEPLYPEITQRLNLAIDDYKKGLEEKKAGSAGSANLSLESALVKLDNIKISYPLLKEANILRLKINKEINAEGFRGEFQKNMQETEIALKKGQTPLVQNKYSSLKEYELVMPGDKDLKNMLNEVEIYLGIRQRPTSQAEMVQSRERVKPAQDIYTKRQRDLYPRAIELLNEAIRIWPDNKEAKQLKDKLQIARGEVVQSIITADDQQSLIRAEKLYSERNYAESYSITQRLLKKTANQNYPPLTALNDKNMIRLGLK